MKMPIPKFLSPLLVLLCASSAVHAQLQITEFMADPANNNDWEWIEIHNAGTAAIDLDGYFFDDGNPTAPTGNSIPEGGFPNIDSAIASTTVIPAGGTAVLYDGSGLDFDDSRFRSAWQVGPSVPVIAVDFWSALNNGGDAFGFWATREAYDLDTADFDEDGDMEVVQFDNAALSLNYFEGFTINDEVSIAWNGNGDFRDGANWAVSEAGVGGAVTSVQTFLPGMDQLNNEGDFGNPGVAPSGTANGLVITEMMTNPASEEPEWEWIEVYNGTGTTIDFGSTPHVFDENGGSALTEPNLTEGSIADGEVAVLFNGTAITAADMEAAWGAGNYIPVDGWQALNNGGDDLVGIWGGVTDGYISDKEATATDADPPATSYSNALTWATYDSDLDDGASSFSLVSLDADPTDPANWIVSTTGTNANPVFLAGQPVDHEGGEIGSPGVFNPGAAGLTCDFDADGDCQVDDIDALYATGDVSAADIDAWLVAASSSSNSANPSGNTLLRGDINLDGNVNSSDLGLLLNNFNASGNVGWGDGNLNDDGVVDSSDLGQLLNNFGTSASSAAVPEPGSSAMLLAVFGAILCLRRHLGV